MVQRIHKIDSLITAAHEHLQKQSFSQGSIQKYLCTWKKVKNFMVSSNLEDYNVAVGEAFIHKVCDGKEFDQLTKEQKQLQRKITYLTEFQESGSVTSRRKNADFKFEGAIGKLIAEYMEHILSLGYSLCTIKNHKAYLHRFLSYLTSNQILSVKDINTFQLIIFIKSHGFLKPSIKHGMLSAIKQFLRYLYRRELLEIDYSKKIPKDNFVRQPKLPSVYSAEEINRMTQSIDRGNPKGKRDYAIILLAARLGLRATDICHLQFENLDWPQCLIALKQQKTGEHIALPLTNEIGSAIIDYLKYGRPTSESKHVFLNLIPPYGRMTNSNLATITSYCLTNAGIDVSGRRHGTHCLRHSLSAILLKGKTPLPVISEVLGHKDIGSTMYYLRVDIDSLLKCALEVPLVASSFYSSVTTTYFKNQLP